MPVQRQPYRIAGRALAGTAALALATGIAGCSLLSRGDTPAAEGTEVAGAAPQKAALRKIAILPVAFSAAGGGQSCDMCPESLALKPTSAETARLVTAFFYESIARHPRFLTVRYETAAAAASKGMRAAVAELGSGGHADLVLIAALVELRPRLGDDEAPERPAGAALFASLVDARSGAVLWSDTFDEEEKRGGRVRKLYDVVVGGVPRKWHSAEAFTETGVRELVESLVDEVGD